MAASVTLTNDEMKGHCHASQRPVGEGPGHHHCRRSPVGDALHPREPCGKRTGPPGTRRSPSFPGSRRLTHWLRPAPLGKTRPQLTSDSEARTQAGLQLLSSDDESCLLNEKQDETPSHINM